MTSISNFFHPPTPRTLGYQPATSVFLGDYDKAIWSIKPFAAGLKKERCGTVRQGKWCHISKEQSLSGAVMAINPSFNHKISPNLVAFNFIRGRYNATQFGGE